MTVQTLQINGNGSSVWGVGAAYDYTKLIDGSLSTKINGGNSIQSYLFESWTAIENAKITGVNINLTNTGSNDVRYKLVTGGTIINAVYADLGSNFTGLNIAGGLNLAGCEVFIKPIDIIGGGSWQLQELQIDITYDLTAAPISTNGNMEGWENNHSNVEVVLITFNRSLTKAIYNATIHIPKAFPEEADVQYMQAGDFSMRATVQKWHIPASYITGGYEILIGDTITDEANDVWVVKDSSLKSQKTRWECITVKEV